MAFWLMTENEPRPSHTKERGTLLFTVLSSGIKDKERQVNAWLTTVGIDIWHFMLKRVLTLHIQSTGRDRKFCRSEATIPPLRRQQSYDSKNPSSYH